MKRKKHLFDEDLEVKLSCWDEFPRLRFVESFPLPVNSDPLRPIFGDKSLDCRLRARLSIDPNLKKKKLETGNVFGWPIPRETKYVVHRGRWVLEWSPTSWINAGEMVGEVVSGCACFGQTLVASNPTAETTRFTPFCRPSQGRLALGQCPLPLRAVCPSCPRLSAVSISTPGRWQQR